jgi:hypothetical protein
MSAGSLKIWNVERGFGFIQDDAGGPDMFLHITALQDAGISPDSLTKSATPAMEGRKPAMFWPGSGSRRRNEERLGGSAWNMRIG